MRFILWRIWSEDCLHALRWGHDPYVYWLTAIAVVTLLLTLRELVRNRRRYRLLILLNIIFLASVALHVMSEIVYGVDLAIGASEGSGSLPEFLAEVVLRVFAHDLGWFYVSFVSLLLLSLCMFAGSIRKEPERYQEA